MMGLVRVYLFVEVIRIKHVEELDLEKNQYNFSIQLCHSENVLIITRTKDH